MKAETKFQRHLNIHTRMVGQSYFERGGQATSSNCPRKGYSWLRDKREKIHVVETACKTWGCLACRDRVRARVQAVLKTGLSTSKVSWLITNTFVLDERGPMGVGGVRKVWVSFLQSLRREPATAEMQWFKVTELTKKGQVHLHWVSLGPEDLTGQCRPKMGSPKNGKPCLVSPECLEHRLRRFWLAATGSSYIVDVRRVFSNKGACSYLGKYFFKSVAQRKALAGLGFKRRYDTSRGWPREPKLVLRGTAEGWAATGRFRGDVVGPVRFAAQRPGARELDLVGPEAALRRVERSRAKRLVSLGKVLQNESLR